MLVPRYALEKRLAHMQALGGIIHARRGGVTMDERVFTDQELIEQAKAAWERRKAARLAQYESDLKAAAERRRERLQRLSEQNKGG